MTPPNHELRGVKALEGIEKNTKELIKVFEAMNNNLCLFAKIIQDAMEPLDEPDPKQTKLEFPDGCVQGVCPDNHAVNDGT